MHQHSICIFNEMQIEPTSAPCNLKLHTVSSKLLNYDLAQSLPLSELNSLLSKLVIGAEVEQTYLKVTCSAANARSFQLLNHDLAQNLPFSND